MSELTAQGPNRENRSRLWSEIYPHTTLFPDLGVSYAKVQHEL
jgi:hypothetical protein